MQKHIKSAVTVHEEDAGFKLDDLPILDGQDYRRIRWKRLSELKKKLTKEKGIHRHGFETFEPCRLPGLLKHTDFAWVEYQPGKLKSVFNVGPIQLCRFYSTVVPEILVPRRWYFAVIELYRCGIIQLTPEGTGVNLENEHFTIVRQDLLAA